MADMLDFYGKFWEDLLDSESPIVENNSITNGGMTYATSDYLDDGLSFWRMQELAETKAELAALSGRRKGRAKNAQHHLVEN